MHLEYHGWRTHRSLEMGGDSPFVAEAFAVDDPYVTNGVVKGWRVREWTTVVGPLAEGPVAE